MAKASIIHENNYCHYTHTYILYLYLPNGTFQEQLFKLLKLLITVQLKLIKFKKVTPLLSVCPTIWRGGNKAFKQNFFLGSAVILRTQKIGRKDNFCKATKALPLRLWTNMCGICKEKKKTPKQENAWYKYLSNKNFMMTSSHTEEGNFRTYVEQLPYLTKKKKSKLQHLEQRK